jgi:hypothetical protein
MTSPTAPILPPGYTITDTGDHDGSVILTGCAWIVDGGGDVVDSAAEAHTSAWCDYLRTLTAMPDSMDPDPATDRALRASAMRYLCVMYADRIATGADAGRVRPGLGQRASARALHVSERTMRCWCAGDRPIPWSAAELLRIIATVSRP